MIEFSPQLLLRSGPPLLFAMAFAETAVPLGIMVPAGVALATGALLAHQGYLAWELVLAASISGAIAGDSAGFWLGKKGSSALLRVPGPFGRRVAMAQVRTSRLFRSHALVAISGGRLVAFVRTFMPATAGASGVAYLRFVAFDLVGIVGWALLYVSIGIASAEGWRALRGVQGSAVPALASMLAALVLGLLVRRLLQRSRRRRRTPCADRADVTPGPGARA